jgi:pSer/pThr/pTyr-binding forkhead associated (FHA) protein
MIHFVDFRSFQISLQDTKSSGGTFLNGIRLSPQGQESTPVEVHDGDIIKLGEDCEVNGGILRITLDQFLLNFFLKHCILV